jgi:predicted Zn-dependent protease
LVWRGRVYERMKNRDAALTDYRRAVQRDPGHAEGRRALGQLLLETNEYTEAEGHFKALSQLQPGDPTARLGAARCAVVGGDVDRARQALDELLVEYPDTVRALIERGNLASDGRDLTNAERLLRRAVELAPGDPTALYALAQCLRRQGRDADADAIHSQFVQAEADLSRVGELIGQLADRPRDPDLRYEIGKVFLRNHRGKEGLRWLGSALEYEPTHPPTLAALADHYERTGDRLRAEHFRSRIRPTPDRPARPSPE